MKFRGRNAHPNRQMCPPFLRTWKFSRLEIEKTGTVLPVPVFSGRAAAGFAGCGVEDSGRARGDRAKASTQRGQVSNGALGILWPQASGPQQRVPTSGSVSLVLTNRTALPFLAAS